MMQTVRNGQQTVKLREYLPDGNGAVTWEELEAHWPTNLVKACADPFGYALGLRDGTVLNFSEAEPTASGEWVHLQKVNVRAGDALKGIDLDRGIDVAVREIVWVVDAPDGS